MSELVDRLMEKRLINRSGSKPYLQALEYLTTSRTMDTFGPKVQDFHRTIMGDEDGVVADSHSCMIGVGWYEQAGSWGFPLSAYRGIVKAHKEAADYLGIKPRQAQAGPWGWHKKFCKTKDVNPIAETYIQVQHLDNARWQSNHGYYLTADVAKHYLSTFNVIYAWQQMTEEEIDAGMEWYDKALLACIEASGQIGMALDDLVAVVALVSPGRNWDNNIHAATEFIHTARELELI
jgi:hypothetical protein